MKKTKLILAGKTIGEISDVLNNHILSECNRWIRSSNKRRVFRKKGNRNTRKNRALFTIRIRNAHAGQFIKLKVMKITHDGIDYNFSPTHPVERMFIRDFVLGCDSALGTENIHITSIPMEINDYIPR